MPRLFEENACIPGGVHTRPSKIAARLAAILLGRSGRFGEAVRGLPVPGQELGDARDRVFAGSDRGGQRAAFMYGLIVTARMNDIDPQAWLADVLARIADIPQSRLHELLPWEWKRLRELPKAA